MDFEDRINYESKDITENERLVSWVFVHSFFGFISSFKKQSIIIQNLYSKTGRFEGLCTCHQEPEQITLLEGCELLYNSDIIDKEQPLPLSDNSQMQPFYRQGTYRRAPRGYFIVKTFPSGVQKPIDMIDCFTRMGKLRLSLLKIKNKGYELSR